MIDRVWYTSSPGKASLANHQCWPNAGLLLGHRLRRWPSNNPALGEISLQARFVSKIEFEGQFAAAARIQWRLIGPLKL